MSLSKSYYGPSSLSENSKQPLIIDNNNWAALLKDHKFKTLTISNSSITDTAKNTAKLIDEKGVVNLELINLQAPVKFFFYLFASQTLESIYIDNIILEKGKNVDNILTLMLSGIILGGLSNLKKFNISIPEMFIQNQEYFDLTIKQIKLQKPNTNLIFNKAENLVGQLNEKLPSYDEHMANNERRNTFITIPDKPKYNSENRTMSLTNIKTEKKR